jgi:hypothetical protein
MNKIDKPTKNNVVPLLCWDICSEYLNTKLGRNKMMEKVAAKKAAKK